MRCHGKGCDVTSTDNIARPPSSFCSWAELEKSQERRSVRLKKGNLIRLGKMGERTMHSIVTELSSHQVANIAWQTEAQKAIYRTKDNTS